MSDDALGHLPVAERSKVNYGRKMLAKEHEDRIRIVKAIPSGEDTFGCIACCHAPSCCALMSLCPCCTNPEYIIHKRASSKYIYIRENSIEWNDPEASESRMPPMCRQLLTCIVCRLFSAMGPASGAIRACTTSRTTSPSCTSTTRCSAG